MNKALSICIALLLSLFSQQLFAQKAKKGSDKIENKPAVVSTIKGNTQKMIYPYLGHSNLNNGNISKRLFDSLLHQGITAKDTAGILYKISGFMFSYAARNLYEDSIGNLEILTDYFSEFCPGDTVSRAISLNIYYKTKPGDTAYFDQIKANLPNGGQVGLKSMKFVLTK